MTDNRFYVYVLLDPRKPGKFKYPNIDKEFDFEPFYIGKGTGGRDGQHSYSSERTHIFNKIKAGKIKHILELGFKLKHYTIRVIDNVIESEAFLIEKDYIKNIGRIDLDTGPLANLCDGGEGGCGAISKSKGKTYEEIYGPEKAEWMKAVRSERFKGDRNPMFGTVSHFKNRIVSEEERKHTSKMNSVPILQFTKEGKLVKEWASATEAANYFDIHSTAISNHLKGRTKSCQGFIWKYKEENDA